MNLAEFKSGLEATLIVLIRCLGRRSGHCLYLRPRHSFFSGDADRQPLSFGLGNPDRAWAVVAVMPRGLRITPLPDLSDRSPYFSCRFCLHINVVIDF
jgi:hypothetical protein